MEKMPMGKYECSKVDFLCCVGESGCRHWIGDWNLGCCAMRNTEPRDHEEISQILGIRRFSVQRLEKNAMEKLRSSPELKALWEDRRLILGEEVATGVFMRAMKQMTRNK